MGILSKFTKTAAVAALVTIGSISAASAVTLGFYTVPTDGGTPGNSAIDPSGQVSVDVTDGGDGALFSFSVTDVVGQTPTITQIYFDDRTPLFAPPPQIEFQSAGVDFEAPGGVGPGDLPGGNNALGSPFVTTVDLLARRDSGAGGVAKGVSSGESLILKLVYEASIDFADVLAALTDGSLRLGMHLQTLAGGASDSVVNNPPGGGGGPGPIPLPASGLLLLAGFGGLAGMRRFKKS